MKKKKDLLKLQEALETGLKQGSAIFRYAIKKNLFVIENEIESLKAAKYGEAPTYPEFEQGRLEIYQKYGVVSQENPNYLTIPMYEIDENGKEDTTKVSEKYTNSQKEFADLIEKLKDGLEKHSKEITDYNLEIEAYNKMLEENLETEFTFVEINISDCPNSFMEIDTLMDFGVIK